MNEITLSNNLSQIELEISHHKQIAGQSIWEIGRRLNHVKENDLAHGEFMDWYLGLGIDKDFASKSMKIAKELPNFETFRNLGTTALHLIATFPEEEKQEQIQRIEDGDTPTVRELQEVKKKLKLSKLVNERLRAENEKIKSSKTEVKETIKEVIPDDYKATQDLNRQLLEKNKELSKTVKAIEERSEFIEKQLADTLAQREEVDKKSAQYDELTRAIEESQGQLNSVQKQILAYKNITSLLQKGNDFLASMGGLIYADEEKVLKADGIIRNEFDSFISRGLRFFNDLNDIRKESNILEGEFE
nr:MAG TPA: phosphodiesterase [Caudoviricetes sp.]